MILKNTEENASVEMISIQRAGGEENRIEFKQRGGFYIKNGAFYITYRESDDMGTGNSRVILKVSDNEAVMRRMGEFNTVMVYKKGEVTEFVYRMSFGEMNFKIDTKNIENSLGANGGKLIFTYRLISGENIALNQVSITVKKDC